MKINTYTKALWLPVTIKADLQAVAIKQQKVYPFEQIRTRALN